MDLNFGEIVEPVSRAFYDDYDDASLNLPFERFEFVDFLQSHCKNFCFVLRPAWIFSEEVPGKIQNFIVIEGNNAMNLVSPSILKKTSPMAKLEGHKVEVFNLPNVTICVVEEKNLNYFATITELLEPWIKIAEHCTIVSLQSTSEFKSDEVMETCIVRSIKSSLADVPALEAPNFITGVVAGVGTFRQLNDLPFACFVVYIDLFDVFAIRTVLNLLKRLQLPVDESVGLKALHHKSDLYM